MSFIILACKVECLGNVGASECFKERRADLGAGEWRCRSQVVCDRKTVVMLGQLGEGQRVQNLIREGRNE